MHHLGAGRGLVSGQSRMLRTEGWLKSLALNKQRSVDACERTRGHGRPCTAPTLILMKREKNVRKKKERWLDVTGRGQLGARKSSCYITQGDPLCSRNNNQAPKSAFKASRTTGGGDHIEGKKNPGKKGH